MLAGLFMENLACLTNVSCFSTFIPRFFRKGGSYNVITMSYGVILATWHCYGIVQCGWLWRVISGSGWLFSHMLSGAGRRRGCLRHASQFLGDPIRSVFNLFGAVGELMACVQSQDLGAWEPRLPRFILLGSFSDTLLVVLILDIPYDCHL